jgi:hypothetical protein
MMMERLRGVKVEPDHSPKRQLLIGGWGFDWVVIVLSGWFLGGLFLDGWAHNHIPELESFFTPWHAVFYSGFLAVASFLVATVLRNYRSGYAWQHALPPGYELSLLGILIFVAGGIGDMIWHVFFGIEADVEALLSPTHLTLAVGGTLIIGGPFRAGWRRSGVGGQADGWAAQLPQLLALTFLLSLWTFMTQFVHPLVDPWAAAGFRPRAENVTFFRQALGIASILLQTGLLMGLVFLDIERWLLPLGGLTLVFALNAMLMSFMHDQYRFIPVAAGAGVVADLLLRWLKPSATRLTALRLFAFAVPAVYYGLYFLLLLLTEGVGWSVHLWAGSIVLAGIVSWLLSYILVPPARPSIR